MAHVHGLRCRECGREYDVAPIFTCEWCFGPLEVAYDYDAIARVDRAARRSRRARSSIWRYADLLPVERNPAVDLGAGFTPLVRADRLAAELGLGEVWIKNDTAQPHELVQGPRHRRSRCRRRSSSASRSRRARRPATSPTRSPRTPRTPGCAASCSSRRTSSRARSSRPRSTAATSSRSTATTTTSTASAPSSPARTRGRS